MKVQGTWRSLSMKRSGFELLKLTDMRLTYIGWTFVSADHEIFEEQGETNSGIKEKRQGEIAI